MPNLDGTGPRGLGSGTGRKTGRCNASFKSVSNENADFSMKPMRNQSRNMQGRGRRCRHVQEN